MLFTFPSGYLEAELVHGVNLVEIIHNKIEQRCSDSNRAVVFSGFIYLDLVNLSFQDLRVSEKQRHRERWNRRREGAKASTNK